MGSRQRPIVDITNASEPTTQSFSRYHPFIDFTQHAIDTNLKACPACVDENLSEFGQPYWHLTHQIRGLETCPIHNVHLIHTSKGVPSSYSWHLDPLEVDDLTNPRKGQPSDWQVFLANNISRLPMNTSVHHASYFLTRRLADSGFPIGCDRHLDRILEATRYRCGADTLQEYIRDDWKWILFGKATAPVHFLLICYILETSAEDMLRNHEQSADSESDYGLCIAGRNDILTRREEQYRKATGAPLIRGDAYFCAECESNWNRLRNPRLGGVSLPDILATQFGDPLKD